MAGAGKAAPFSPAFVSAPVSGELGGRGPGALRHRQLEGEQCAVVHAPLAVVFVIKNHSLCLVARVG